MFKKCLFLIIICTTALHAQSWDKAKIAHMFGKHNGAMIVYDLNKNVYYRFNPVRCKERFLPASTFKIPNSLIGLEAGVIADENFMIEWDGINRPIKEWNRDQTLETALKYSVVPYYQELARRVGKTAYVKYLKEMKYGNMKIGNRIDTFWLDNSLKISAEEQIAFLKKFYKEELLFSERSFEIVKKIMSAENYGKSILKFKTGTGNLENGKYLGWLVGYILNGENVYMYAFNIEGKTFEEVANLRNELPRKILAESDFLE